MGGSELSAVVKDSPTNYENRSADRIFALLEFVGAAARPARLREIARETALNRATAFRLLAVLQEKGFVYKDSTEHTYSVGQRLFSLGGPRVRTPVVQQRIMPLLRRIAYATDMTACFATLEGTQIVICRKVETPRSLKTLPAPGTWLDAHATALGKTMLASRARADVRAMYRRRRLDGYTAKTVTKPDALVASLDSIRQAGYALNLGEMADCVHCLAVPLINSRGYANYAVSLSGPSGQYPVTVLANLAPVLKQTVSEMRLLIFRQS